MKLAKDLEPGDRVVMADGNVKIVADLARGFATFVEVDGKKRSGVLIGWADREFSTVPVNQRCTLEDDL